jgi:hypothetical protein
MSLRAEDVLMRNGKSRVDHNWRQQPKRRNRVPSVSKPQQHEEENYRRQLQVSNSDVLPLAARNRRDMRFEAPAILNAWIEHT